MQLIQLTSLLLVLTLAACGSSDKELEVADSLGVQSQNVEPPGPIELGVLNVVTHQQIPTKSDSFVIEKAKILGDQLQLKVEYGGGCESHTFTAYSTSQSDGGSPATVEIFIAHDANNDSCEAYLREEIEIDLSPLKKAYFAAEPAAETGTLNIKIKTHKVNVVYIF